MGRLIAPVEACDLKVDYIYKPWGIPSTWPCWGGLVEDPNQRGGSWQFSLLPKKRIPTLDGGGGAGHSSAALGIPAFPDPSPLGWGALTKEDIATVTPIPSALHLLLAVHRQMQVKGELELMGKLRPCW